MIINDIDKEMKIDKETYLADNITLIGEEDYYSCPTLQIAMKWLREVHGISIDIITNFEWIRDSMASSTDIEYPEISEFTGYYFEIHQLVPHRLLYDSPVISKTYNKVCDKAIKYCLVNLI